MVDAYKHTYMCTSRFVSAFLEFWPTASSVGSDFYPRDTWIEAEPPTTLTRRSHGQSIESVGFRRIFSDPCESSFELSPSTEWPSGGKRGGSRGLKNSAPLPLGARLESATGRPSMVRRRETRTQLAKPGLASTTRAQAPRVNNRGNNLYLASDATEGWPPTWS